VESLLGDEVPLLQTRLPFRKGQNFGIDRWISLKFLHEFQDAVFLGVDVDSLRGDVEVSLLKTRVSVENGHNF